MFYKRSSKKTGCPFMDSDYLIQILYITTTVLYMTSMTFYIFSQSVKYYFVCKAYDHTWVLFLLLLFTNVPNRTTRNTRHICLDRVMGLPSFAPTPASFNILYDRISSSHQTKPFRPSCDFPSDQISNQSRYA